MFKNQHTSLTQETLNFNYLPASLKQNKSGWVIDYYCEDPNTRKMKRVRTRVEKIHRRYRTQAEAKAHIFKIVNEINIKLMKGWNPFISADDIRLYTPFKTATEKFIAEKQKELRPDTIRSYKSFINTLNTFVDTKCPELKFSSAFNKLCAIRFMDYIYNDRGVSQRSYNNYLKFMRVFFNWALEKGYTTSNPFAQIKGKQKTDKKRGIIDKETRQTIIQHLQEHDPQMLVVCKLMYYCLIRPKEIISLKVGDVDFDKRTIFVSGTNAKNHHSRFASMTQDVIDSLQYIKNYQKDMFLISQSMMPSYIQAHRAKLGKIWIRLRKQLHLPDEMQLYSFRDTGIFEMLKAGLDPLTVKQHADHHSLAMTTIYSDHPDPNLTKTIYEKSPQF